MGTPRVSLIMPVYNNVQFIKRAIRSVQNQTYTDWELVIVDDASLDGAAELAEVLAATDPRISFHKNETRLGVAKNRRKAVEFCKGEFIGHIDSDDMLERWALEEVINTFTVRPNVALVYSDMAQVDINDNIESYSASPDFDANILHRHGWRHFGVYKRSAYESTEGFNTKLKNGCEDGDLFMQIAEHFPCFRIPKVLYYYRNHSHNMTKSMQKCDDCTQRTECNYMRVWAKSANYDVITFKPKKEQA